MDLYCVLLRNVDAGWVVGMIWETFVEAEQWGREQALEWRVVRLGVVAFDA